METMLSFSGSIEFYPASEQLSGSCLPSNSPTCPGPVRPVLSVKLIKRKLHRPSFLEKYSARMTEEAALFYVWIPKERNKYFD